LQNDSTSNQLGYVIIEKLEKSGYVKKWVGNVRQKKGKWKKGKYSRSTITSANVDKKHAGWAIARAANILADETIVSMGTLSKPLLLFEKFEEVVSDASIAVPAHPLLEVCAMTNLESSVSFKRCQRPAIHGPADSVKCWNKGFLTG